MRALLALTLLCVLPQLQAQCTVDLQTRAAASLTLPANAASGTNPFALEEAFGLGAAFTRPVGIIRDPVNDRRLYIVGQRGVIYLIRDLDTPTLETYMDISSIVDSSSNEEGLLGLAFHPDYAANGQFYTFFTTSSNQGCGRDDVLARFTRDALDPDRGDPSTRVDLIRQCDQASNHNAGPIHFGPDKYLYVALGDEGGANDTYNNGQRLDRDFFAGLLRIDVDKLASSLAPNPHPAVVTDAGVARYAVPADNPYIGLTSLNGSAINPADLRTEFYAHGLRNPWQFSFDLPSGRLYCADVGQNLYEEINVITAGGNYGWAVREGFHAGPDSTPTGFSAINPILEYEHNNGNFGGYSVTGGRVYRGASFSDLYGHYVFADYVTGRTWACLYDGNTVSDWRLLLTENGTSAIGEDPRNGDLLFADRDQGLIRRLTRAPVGNLPATLDDTGLFCDTATLAPADGVLPYELKVPFWSDGAVKQRWFSLPDPVSQATPAIDGPWSFPAGSTFVKHFEIEMITGDPNSRRRLETRVLVKTTNDIYGLTYRWDGADNATLVGDAGFDEDLTIDDNGSARLQTWRYPSRAECLQCHTPVAGYVLGFHTAQLNRPAPAGAPLGNQLDWLNSLGYLSSSLGTSTNLPAMAALDDSTRPAVERVRAWLHTNCAMCHQPGGTGVGQFDARFHIPTEQAGLVNGGLFNSAGDAANRVIAGCDIPHSMLLTRVETNGITRMPPIGRSIVDPDGSALLREWINDFCNIELSKIILPLQANNQLRWTSQPGGDYEIEASDSLITPLWQSIGNLVATDIQSSFAIPAEPEARRFYRIRLK